MLLKRWGLPTATNAGRWFDADPRLQNLSDLDYKDREIVNRCRGRATESLSIRSR